MYKPPSPVEVQMVPAVLASNLSGCASLSAGTFLSGHMQRSCPGMVTELRALSRAV